MSEPFETARDRHVGARVAARYQLVMTVAVALLGGLGGGAEEFADSCPRDLFAAGCGDGVDDLSFATCSCEGGSFEEVFLDGSFVAGVGFVVLEPCGEFVGVVEDVLDRAWHQVPRNLSRARMA